MQVTREDLNPCTVKLNVVCSPEQVAQAFDKAYRQAAKRVRIPGFRPGHAPKHLVQQSVAPEAIRDMAAENVIEKAFKEALGEMKLEPAGQPSVEVSKLSEEESACEFSAKVPLPPQVELGDYKTLEIERPSDEVTDAEVDEQIEEMRKRKGTRETITDRGAQEGDSAVVNIRVDGEEGDGRNFMIVIGKTFKALDGALTGMNAEEMKSLDLKFPKEFQEKDWAGKQFHCTVTLRSMSSFKLPELDDDFAQSFKADNLDEFRKRLKDQMVRAKSSAINDFVNEKILDLVLQSSIVHVPDTMWESVANRKLQDIAMEQGQAGKTFEEYAKENGMTVEQLVEAQREEAKLFVQRAVVVREIFAQEKMELSNQELNIELFDMAREFNVAPQELLTVLRKNRAVDDLYFRAIYRKVTKFLSDNTRSKSA